MPFDLDTLLGSDPSGLLTPQERGGVTGQGLMSMGAAMLKAAAPSPYKHTTLSGLGEGLQGLLSGKQTATDELLKQHLVRAKTLEGALPLYKLMQDQAATGMPMPDLLQNLYRGIAPALGLGMPGGIGAGAPGAPGAPGAAPGAAPGVPGVGAPGGISPPSGAPAETGGFKIPSDWRPPPQSPGAYPPTDIRQYHADMNGFNRRVLTPGAPGNAAFEKSFEESHAGDPGYDLRKEREAQTKQDIQDYGKRYTGIVATGQIAASVKQYAELAKDLLGSPGFYTGLGSDWVQAWHKLMKLTGQDENTGINDATARMDVFNKIMSEGLLGRIQELQSLNKEYGESGGRSLLTVINTMAKANPNMDMVKPANKFLVDQIVKESQRFMDISDAAKDYAIKHPAQRLDKKWDVTHDKMLRKDIYSEEEHSGIRSGRLLPGNQPVPEPPPPSAGPAPVPGAIGPLGRGGPAAIGLPGRGGFSVPKPGTYNWTPNGMVPVQ